MSHAVLLLKLYFIFFCVCIFFEFVSMVWTNDWFFFL